MKIKDEILNAPANKPRILIACSQNWESIAEVPYIFYKAGCVVDVCCSKYSWLIRNSFFHNWIEIKEKDGFIASILETINSIRYDWIILGDEPLLKKISDAINTEELFKRILPLTKLKTVNC